MPPTSPSKGPVLGEGNEPTSGVTVTCRFHWESNQSEFMIRIAGFSTVLSVPSLSEAVDRSSGQQDRITWEA